MKKGCTLVIFSCEGREHLLKKTYRSAVDKIRYDFDNIIVSHDGKGGRWAVENIKPDLFLQSPVRKGYVPSIQRALKHVETEFFFWLEDDWGFSKPIDICKYLNILSVKYSYSQIIFLKRKMRDNNKISKVEENIFTSKIGFSANPGINRTSHVSNALQDADDSKATNIEHFMTSYFRQHDFDCLVADPGDDIPYVKHLGDLEATGGKWHTIRGGKETKGLPAFDDSELLLSPLRLLVRTAYLAGNTLFDKEARSLARRISNVVKIYKRNKSS